MREKLFHTLINDFYKLFAIKADRDNSGSFFTSKENESKSSSVCPQTRILSSIYVCKPLFQLQNQSTVRMGSICY